MKRLIHAIAHLLGLNSEQQEFWLARNKTVMTGYRCHFCGKMTRIRPLPQCRRDN